jgi:DNA-binding PadR family transcriptional regulator
MVGRAASDRGVAGMSSPVNWALLGLVIERASYGYELALRFERAYGEVLPVSSTSHIYAALNALEARAFVEKVPASVEPHAAGRQPKPHYRATALGDHAYREWLVGQVWEERRRSRLFVRELAIFARDPETALRVIEGHEQVCLQQAAGAPAGAAPQTDGAPGGELVRRLLCEEARLAIDARLSWLEFARREFEGLTKPEETGL